jgi:hypothetical protein
MHLRCIGVLQHLNAIVLMEAHTHTHGYNTIVSVPHSCLGCVYTVPLHRQKLYMHRHHILMMHPLLLLLLCVRRAYCRPFVRDAALLAFRNGFLMDIHVR